MRQLLPLIAWDDVNMQVEDFLSRRVPVLLDDCDAVGFHDIFHHDSYSLDDSVDVGVEVVGHVINGLIMLSGNDKCVTLVKRSDVEKRGYPFVFVHDAGGRFFLHYLTENAQGAVQLPFVTA